MYLLEIPEELLCRLRTIVLFVRQSQIPLQHSFLPGLLHNLAATPKTSIATRVPRASQCLLLGCWMQICFPAEMVSLLSLQLLKQASQACSEALQCFRKPETFACLSVSSAYAGVLWRQTLKLLDGTAGISCLGPLLEGCCPLEREGTLGGSRHVPGLMGSFTEFKAGNGLDTKQVLTINVFLVL